MGIHRNFIFSLLFVNILIAFTCAAFQDICESCKRLEDCPQYAEMTREQQEQWNREYPCKAPTSDDSPIPRLTSIAKENYICCPTHEVHARSVSEGNSGSVPEGQGQPEPHNGPDHQKNLLPAHPHNAPTDLESHARQQNGFFGGFDQCPVQITPPSPQSGCCGVDTSNGNKILDVRQFLRTSRIRRRRETENETVDVTFEDRIAGGRETDLDQYPWTVLLSLAFVNGNEKSYFSCGGSLISSRFVLTAAHCVVNKAGVLNEVEVTLAEYDKRSFPRDCFAVRGQKPMCIENFKVYAKDVIIYPEYVAQHLINDIALLGLSTTVPYTQYIRPICLPPINIDSPQFSNLPLAIAGWGMNMTEESVIKQFTVVNMVPKSECRAHYNHLGDGHLCASGKRTEDTCKGDSGGPLMMMYEGKYYVAGIVSGKTAAYPCGTPVPSLYTNVFYYLDWIRRYVR